MAVDVRDIGLGTADDHQIAAYARDKGMCLITRDTDFANVLDYPPDDYYGLVVVRAPVNAGRVLVLRMIESFLANEQVTSQLAGRLAIIGPTRVRLR